MTTTNVWRSMCVALVLGIAGCQDQQSDPTAPPAGAGADLKQSRLPKHGRVKRGELKVPSSVRVTDRYFAEAARRAINPDDYVCPPSTPVIDFYIDEFFEFLNQEPALFNLLYNQVWADLIPTYEALYLLTDETPQSFGYRGQYTRVLQNTHRDAKRFWDIFSADIQLVAMKGTMLQNVQRTAATYELPFVPPFFGLSESDALFVAGIVREAVLQSQVLDGGNHSLFSFNAFALSAEDGSIPDKIVMGDAILAGYEALGFGDVAPQAIYAHEFAHHIQFENGYFEDPYATEGDPPEQTRYTELMADAMSAYYLTHKRGATMNRKRVQQFLEVFFQIGDCAFGSGGHHGTPNQRMAAARFGFQVADEAHKQGHILSSERFHDLFVDVYPALIAPDAP